jgi:hypothetical protein
MPSIRSLLPEQIEQARGRLDGIIKPTPARPAPMFARSITIAPAATSRSAAPE